VPEDLTTKGHPPGPVPGPPLVRAPAAPSAVPLPVQPLTRGPDAAPPTGHPWRRAVALALLVLLVGAALGAAGFAAEQRAFVWKPAVSETSGGGWRVTGSAGLRPTAPAIAGGRLAWGQGAYTCVLELDAGDTHVVGAAPRGTSIWPPAAGERYVAWIEQPESDDGSARLWVYDADRGRRQSFAVSSGSATPAVSGDLVAWFDGAGSPRVLTLDMSTGRRSVIAEGPDVDYPVVAGDGLVGWLQPVGEGGAPSVALREIAGGRTTTVKLAADGSGLSVGDIQMAGQTLLWTLQGRTSTIAVHDVPSGVTRTIASGMVGSPATDGEVVIWTTADDESGAPVVRGVTLADDTKLEVGRPAGWPGSLAIQGDWVAWTLNEGSWSYLEAVRLP